MGSSLYASRKMLDFIAAGEGSFLRKDFSDPSDGGLACPFG